jgi:alpha-glucosidase
MHDAKRYVFVWNRTRVAAPDQMVDTFHRAGQRVLANIKPAMLTTHPWFDEAARAGLFVRDANGAPHLSRFWGGDAAHLDFTNPETARWWKNNVKQHILDWGIDVTWNDNNEYNINDPAAICFNFGTPTPLTQLRAVQTMLMVRASVEAQCEARGTRGAKWALTRSGGAGMQRYASSWTGDNHTSWKSMKYGVAMCVGLALCGINAGPDVGGFVGEAAPEPELLTRWCFLGALHTRFCMHSWRQPATEPWMYPDHSPLIRTALQLRYCIVPYLYSLLVQCSLTAEPVMRPVFYHFKQFLDESFDFMLGPWLLVAPVYKPGRVQRRVRLPEARWCCMWTHFLASHLEVTAEQTDPMNGGDVALPAPLDRIPIVLREGAIVPLNMQTLDTASPSKLTVCLFPKLDSEETRFSCYLGDGETISDDHFFEIKLSASEQHIYIDGTRPRGVEVAWLLPRFERRELIDRTKIE